MRKMALHWKIIIGIVLGVVWAFVAAELKWSSFTLDWIAPFGTIFMNLLKLIAVPLVLFSIIKGVSGLSDITKLGKVGMKTLAMYLLTTVLAVGIGLTLVNTIKPGEMLAQDQRVINRLSYETWVKNTKGVEIMDDRRILDDPKYAHLLEDAASKLDKTRDLEFFEEKKDAIEETKEQRPLDFLVDMVPDNIFFSLNNNTLMLQVIFFAVFFGITLLLISAEKARPVIQFVEGANEVFLKMVEVIMRGAPFFVFALLAGKLSELAGDDPDNVRKILGGLGWYSLVVLIGLAILAFGFYGLIVALFVKKLSLKKFFGGIGPAQMLAFSTSSSAATLPVTMDCVRDRIGVSKEITSFVLPIGATVNMDGTSLYQAIAVVFLAQFHWVDLSITQQLVIVLTATLASIGSAAVPSAGLIMMMVVLASVGLDPEWIAIIFPVDRILDMCRTVVNVTGDATVASVVASSEGELDVREE